MKIFQILPVLILLSGITKAQFNAGERFVTGDVNISLNDNKHVNPNSTPHYGTYGYNVSASLGHFTTDNKAVGWTLNQSLSLINYDDWFGTYAAPRTLQGFGVGIGRFVEYYKPISEKLALYIRPSLGLTYQLENQDNRQNGDIIVIRNQSNTLTSGINLSAGIAWRLASRWALYGGFAFANPVSISYGWQNSESYQQSSPQTGSTKTEGSFFKYNFSPTLSSGNISLGFRYFYTRNKI
ncbi:hypothetical protein [Salmonirosea aquatica]|uniref:Outer membrane beta-barrel protein n=1 Tax=Salmonirosea aquatica TaxID=2654236 RepID=A0A7C9BAC3_9BACT|nr:hypothetical protein [Cytophagaceae bacterium SJW1-29]